MVFAAVCVAAVNHEAWFDTCLFHLLDGRRYRSDIVVGDLPATAQDDVAVRISGGEKDGRLSRFRGSQKGVRMACGEDGFNRDLDVAGGAVLEADRTREARGELAMNLALGGARANCAPAYQVGDVLRRNHVEELSAGGHAHLGQIKEKATGNAESVADAEGFIEVGIVDQALPTERCTRFL